MRKPRTPQPRSQSWTANAISAWKDLKKVRAKPSTRIREQETTNLECLLKACTGADTVEQACRIVEQYQAETRPRRKRKQPQNTVAEAESGSSNVRTVNGGLPSHGKRR